MICTIIDNETGEIITENFVIEELKDQQKKKEVIHRKQTENEFKMYIDEHCGGFYFLFYKLLEKGIPRQYITRFIYLCTFMDYENKLIFGSAKGDNKYMLQQDLKEVLNLKKDELLETKKVFKENNLINMQDYNIEVNEDYVVKGKLEGSKLKTDKKVRVFNNAIKELYEKSTAREHKKISLLFEILPYVNLKYNILCENPDCEDMKEVDTITLTDLAEILGFSTPQRMKQGLFNLTVNGEKVIALFTVDGESMIFVNPKVYYKGTRMEDVKLLVDMFDAAKNQKAKRKNRKKNNKQVN